MPSRPAKRPLAWGTLRLRLALWNTGVVLAMTVVALLAARYAARATLYHAADAELRGGATEAALALHDLFPDMDAVVAALRRKAASHEERGWFSQLLTEDGSQIWKSEHCPDTVANFPPHKLDRIENVVQVGPYRYVRLRVSQPGHPVFHVRVGTYTTGLDASLSNLVRVLIVLGIVLCALTPLAGWWLAVRATRPVANLIATADRLALSRLGERLPVRGTGDELDRLAVTINGLLDQVAERIDRQQDFLADAAHELRSPLAAMQGAIEAALSRDRSAADYRESLAVVLEEARYLARLANGLLLLAETESRAFPTPSGQADVVGIVRQAVAMFAGAGEEKGVDVSCTAAPSDAIVAGDAAQLRQVVGNLLDNAIRSTPAGGHVAVRVGHERNDGRVSLSVTDTGVGIGAVHLPRIFDRFYKIDPARSRDCTSRSGGLGLPICKAIVERHGGTISVTSRPGAGTTFTVSLPALQSFAGSARGPRPLTIQPAGARHATA